MSVGVEGLIAIGRIVKAFGVRGDVIVQPMTDDPERFTGTQPCVPWKRCRCGRGHRRRGRRDHDRVRRRSTDVAFGCISRPCRTAPLRRKSVGLLVLIPKEERLPLEDGRYYVDDLIGLTVVSTTGERLGTLWPM